jgi:hypothetical protein
LASLQQRTRELIPLTVRTKCNLCRHAVSQSCTLYCAKLKKNVENVRDCPDFEPEPLEYKLYKRM